jgi:hypothetical protein
VEAVSDLVTTVPLASPHGVRSLDRDHPHARSATTRAARPGYVSWLCAWALEQRGEVEAAETLADQTLAAAEGGGMREYFVPESGRGLGARDFARTAALTLRELGAGALTEQGAVAA